MTYMLGVDDNLPLTSFGSLIDLANNESRAKKTPLRKRPTNLILVVWLLP